MIKICNNLKKLEATIMEKTFMMELWHEYGQKVLLCPKLISYNF
jgi:hypothetical protein